MFSNDRPIQRKAEDRLSRISFSKNLAKSLFDWDGRESLVVGLCGKWGTGKSSLINIVKEELGELDKKKTPTIIEFNPWFFSGDTKLIEHFFNEFSKELKLKNTSERDLELARKLKAYSKLLSLIPVQIDFGKVTEKFLVLIGVLGIGAGQIFSFFNIPLGSSQKIFFALGVLLLILSFSNKLVLSIAGFLEARALSRQKTVLSFKKEIRDHLQERDKKILIIIDDIDRLTPEEVRSLFRLIKANTDFPNVIYLLSFDRKIVEASLKTQEGIAGKDYMDKIIQVSFDVPLVKQEKINAILFEELDRILGVMPTSGEKLFDETYWGNIFHSGFKNFFHSLRDVKRFSSSLEFNLSLMFNGDTVEVNPVDFIAMESMRVFAPEFYAFMAAEKDLFTNTASERSGPESDARKNAVEKGLELVPEVYRDSVKNLLRRIFPQIDGVILHGYSSYGSEWRSSWNKKLKVCSPDFYDTYFTLIPGGDEAELSQFEINALLSVIDNQPDLERNLRELLEKGKMMKVLSRLQDYTGDSASIPTEVYLPLIQSLFNISDELPSDKEGMFFIGADMQLARIVYQMLSRTKDKESNFKIYKQAIENSKGLYGPVFCVSLESRKHEKDKEDAMLISDERLVELQELALQKILEARDSGTLISNPNLVGILYRWRDWSKTEDWKEYVNELTQSDSSLIKLIKEFISETTSHGLGDHVGRVRKRVSYKGLEEFASTEAMKSRLESLRSVNAVLYIDNKDLIDLFLDNFGKESGLLDDDDD